MVPRVGMGMEKPQPERGPAGALLGGANTKLYSPENGSLIFNSQWLKESL